ncbi:MAG: endonuclease/exonuclease/phosphatase family protein, partial [Cyclobacteriaceae bacterium]|nr:endonuclease/exonuclease/phosphatase family protein [Cyclobacteriaceae bacterium]
SLVILKLITQKKLDSKKIVVMGDFNCESQDEPILALKTKLQDSFESTLTSPVGPHGTWQSFDPQAVPQRRIDYIFTSNLVVENYRNIDERRKNKLCLSDHLPVYIEVN